MNTFAVNKTLRMDRRLSEVEVGKTVVIKHFENDDIFLKLMEMGCVPGEKIIVEQVAPLGDPISILVAGYILSLRLNEAENIWVEEIPVLTK
ncbi:FeoA family protein [Ferruginibacter sp. SUN106]|uniref:FeoA family protein n=1 Tax=Ferruginibacter sp. SUN106 TaxID=2978348 RepID=UPI003D362025